MKTTNKPYKAAPPAETVERIRRIIAACRLPVAEVPFGDGKMFCSCRIAITRNAGDTAIGTNGKGMNNLYARASGYAEFMERLQNRVIIYPNPASYGRPCRFFPDEEMRRLSITEVEESIRRYMPRTMPACGHVNPGIEAVDCASLPFYYVNGRRVEQLPYSIIRWVNGTNGMCAGNIREEALIQGFNEIFERYCLQEMYRREITPPDVPAETFAKTPIMERLEQIKAEYGMEYQIKDYSLGEGFPVIGLMVYSPDRGKYIMQLGSDLDPAVALERCFTEVFQGYTAQTLTFENGVNACERLDLFNEFKRSFMYGRGRLPQSFFGGKPSYPYHGHTTIPIGNNFGEDLRNITGWIIGKGYDIYVRDNSFLDFPALHIVVPGLSEISRTFCDIDRRIRRMQLTENCINPLYRLRELDREECLATIDYIEDTAGDAIDLFCHNTNPDNHVNRHLLLMLLYVATEQNGFARRSLERYGEYCLSKGKTLPPIFESILMLLQGKSPVGDPQAAALANKFLASPEQAMRWVNVPTCFDCRRCPVAKGCRYTLMQEVEDIMQRRMAGNMINQETLSNIF